MNVLRSIASALLLVLSCGLSPASAESMKYDALCAISGGFDRCGIKIDRGEIIFVSIDGFNSSNYCTSLIIGYRSNPASPYTAITGSVSDLVSVVKAERGIDHDFLFRYSDDYNSPRKKSIVARFKNHSVAIEFATSLVKVLSIAKCQSKG